MALTAEIWKQIQTEYEQGASKGALSEKYGVSRQAIIKRSQKERWIAPVHPELEISEDILNLDLSEVIEHLPEQEVKALIAVAMMMVVRIAEHMKTENLEIKDLKLLADTLATCNKVLTVRTIEQNQVPYDMRDFLAKCTPEQLEIIKPVIDAVAAADREQEPGPNITQFRRNIQ